MPIYAKSLKLLGKAQLAQRKGKEGGKERRKEGRNPAFWSPN